MTSCNDPNLIPINQNGIISFIFVSKVKEYDFSNGTATLVLTSGTSLTGTPLGESSFSGTSALGVVSIAANNVSTIKFTSTQTAETTLQNTLAGFGLHWPSDFTMQANVTLNSGDSLIGNNAGMVYEFDGCDSNYIPCKPYSHWDIAAGFNIKYGNYTATLKFADINTLEFHPLQNSDPTPQPNGQGSSLDVSIALQTGDKIDATMTGNTSGSAGGTASICLVNHDQQRFYSHSIL